ncbi:acyl-CoA synthetase (AMP-forming)/AMP-acid ligase II/enoyl-CoA hydratase/carnithine racemase [Rhodoligotrophos appendicifer]|uniref:AMP-binding protein n=1 Tax=Rhodoligotrophos appendicifer TaxID=987056 RepID=UPI001184E433|nr:AMP-binding protein [Rhodoligotrophos appendicifer]
MARALKTTRPVRDVRTIADIVEIERSPYDDLVTAHNLYDLCLATAEHGGERKALTVLRSPDPIDIGASLTHRQLLAEVTRAANLFHTLGLAPGRGVAAFLMPTLPCLPSLLLGAQVAGIASSINYLLSREAVFDLLNAQQASILVIPSADSDAACWSIAEGALDHVPSLRHVVVAGGGAGAVPGFVGLEEAIAAVRADRLDFAPSSNREEICALFHTGGTTGRPKLVRLTHGNQIHAAFGFAQVFGYDERDCVVSGFPFFHVGGTMTVGLSVLAAGGHVVVPSPYGLRTPAAIGSYWRIVEHFRATVVSGVPTSIAAMANAWTEGTDASSVRMAVTGGAVLPKAVGARFEATTGLKLFETYGMTETAAAIAFNPGRGTPRAGSVGFRAPFSEIRILRQGAPYPTPCQTEESGSVQVRGPQVFPGYLDPRHDVGMLEPDGWLTTGDVGYLTADERLVLTGREKDLIVRSGHNIDPAAIEDVANQFEGIALSAAVGMPDQYAGEVPALFIVPSPGARVDLDALRAHLHRHLHEPPARPRSILVIDALPVTAVGKIFKPALRDRAIAEKVRLEALQTCGDTAEVAVKIGLDAKKQTLVDVTVTGATPEGVQALSNVLRPLPQTYTVSSAGAPSASPVILEVDGAVALLTLNRPEAMNALSREVMTDLESKVRSLQDRKDIRVVIVTGNGRAFCAGGDLLEFGEALETDKARLLHDLAYNQSVLQLIEDLPMPVIGAANGVAVAGGLELLLCCDIILAAAGVKMGDGHAQYGVVPAGGATVRLGERISPGRAAHLFYTASLMSVERLADWGLVNEIVPREQLLSRARELADEIGRRSPETIRHMKSLTGWRSTSPERKARMQAELAAFASHLDGRDLQRGLAAFKQKQSPRYDDPQ